MNVLVSYLFRSWSTQEYYANPGRNNFKFCASWEIQGELVWTMRYFRALLKTLEVNFHPKEHIISTSSPWVSEVGICM